MAPPLDVLVVGAGHNGLVAATLLARQGLAVRVVEASETVGGAVRDGQPFGPGWTVPVLASRVGFLPPSLREALDLASHGYRAAPLGPRFAAFPDGRTLPVLADRAALRSRVATFSVHDAEAMPAFLDRLDSLAARIGPWLRAIPPSVRAGGDRGVTHGVRLAWKLLDIDPIAWVEANREGHTAVADFVGEYFRSDEVAGVMAAPGVAADWADPGHPGTTGRLAVARLAETGWLTGGGWEQPIGGVGALVSALVAALQAAGGTVSTGRRVRRVEATDTEQVRVVLDDGDELLARFALLAVQPVHAWLDLIGPDALSPDTAAAVRRWRARSGLVKINLGVDRLPSLAAAGARPEVPLAGTLVLGARLRGLFRGFLDATSGRASTTPYVEMTVPTVHDPTLAPAGHHVVSICSQWVPAGWADVPDPVALDRHADRVVAAVDEVCPGFADSVVHRQVLGPHELAHFGMLGGNPTHGEGTPSQAYLFRPVPGFADHRTPVPGVYYAGSGAHGGVGVSGIPGRNAAAVLLHDIAHPRSRRWPRAVFP